MLRVIAIAVSVSSVFLLIWGLTHSNTGVHLGDEWKQSRVKTSMPDTKKYLALGILLAFSGGYVVTGRLLYALICIPVGWFLASWFRERQRSRRYDLLKDQYVQVVGALMTSLQGGASPYQALEEVVPGLSSPSREIFVEILRRNRTGVNYYEALSEVASESGWDDLEKLQMAFALYNKTGANLIEIFSYLLKSAYESKADRKYVQAVTAQIRMTTVLLSFVAPSLIVLMRLMAPEFAAPLFDTAGGFIVMVLVGCMILLGNKTVEIMMKKVIKEA